MKKLKAPKGSIEALRQSIPTFVLCIRQTMPGTDPHHNAARQQAASPKPEASPPPASPPTAASPSSPPEAVPKPIAPPPRPKQPEPTYEDLDALLKGSAPRAPAPSPAPAPSGPMPTLSRPSYEVGGSIPALTLGFRSATSGPDAGSCLSGGSGVSMPAFDKGDRVPMEGYLSSLALPRASSSAARF